MSAALEALRRHVARGAGVDAASVADDTPLVASGLLTSLQAVELLDLAEELSGRPVDLSRVGPATFRDLRSVAAELLGEPLVERRIVEEPLSGGDLELHPGLDRLIAEAAISDGASEELHAPWLPLDVLRRAGWLGSFPHLATLGARIAPGSREAVAASEDDASQQLDTPTHALPPASCHAALAARAGTSVGAPQQVPVSGPCWRAEETAERFVRHRCFTMREVVVLGSPADAEAFVARWSARLLRLAPALGVGAELQVASDPFFDPSRDPKARAQAVLGPVKHELVDDRGVALASVNLHRAFFSTAFGFRHEEGACWSACAAFGLERWTGALRGSSPDWTAVAEALR